MITDDERFIEIQAILANSDISTTNCVKINDLIIELSKENQQLKETLKGTTHCYDEAEHKRLEEENERLKKELNKQKENMYKEISNERRRNKKYKEVV